MCIVKATKDKAKNLPLACPEMAPNFRSGNVDFLLSPPPPSVRSSLPPAREYFSPFGGCARRCNFERKRGEEGEAHPCSNSASSLFGCALLM